MAKQSDGGRRMALPLDIGGRLIDIRLMDNAWILYDSMMFQLTFVSSRVVLHGIALFVLISNSPKFAQPTIVAKTRKHELVGRASVRS